MTVVDDFGDVSGWHAVASGLAELAIAGDSGPRGHAMRLDFDFHGGGGFVVARKLVALTLPESFALHFDLRGAALRNRLELKLADPSGRNVWWYHDDDVDFPVAWRAVRVTSSQIEFAWGPAGGGTPSAIGAIELAITATNGGRGTVWIHDLRLEDRTVRAVPIVRATSAAPAHAAANVFDPSPGSSWRSATDGAQSLAIDFQAEREYGGLVIRWEPDGRARAFTVSTSNDAVAWTPVYSATQADAERSYVYMPKTSARHLRLDLAESVSGHGFGIEALEVRPYDFSRTINGFFQAVAREAPRGAYPKWLCGEQTYWSPVAVPDPETCALLNEEGMIEVDRGSFALEPFVFTDDRLVTWADAARAQVLEDGYLPIPSSLWTVDGLRLVTTAFARRIDGRPVLFVRHRLESTSPRRVRLFVAIRPFQVTPPWQAFGALGGVTRVGELAWEANAVRVDGTKLVIPLVDPDGFGALAFEQGTLADRLRHGDVPPRTRVGDAFGYASGALRFDLDLGPAGPRDVVLAIPFGATEGDASAVVDALRRTSAAEAFDATVREWQATLGHVEIDLPAIARDHADTMRTATSHVLVNRDGPALQPGPRRYTRSWIRDGAIMAAALLRMGRAAEAMEFVRWYAGHQAADGTVPCCVDRNGPDWLVEHDSHGELVYAVMECFRFTGDRGFLAAMWPAARKAVDHLERLRATRLGPEYETPEKRARHGLLPESASHEGYLAQPVHSYWDDFWAVRAIGDAAAMADALGDPTEARRLDALRDAFRASVRASLELTMAERGIAYVPGSVEWADFDPTATSNAVGLLGELPHLPRAALERTFDQYLEGFRRRARGEIEWANYTAYEVRIVGALVALGRRADANEVADFLLRDRRPPPWNQWPEISWRDPKSPGHIGDVPHAWIGAEYVLSFRSMLAYERQADGALVLAAGVPEAWLADGGTVAVRNLPTYYGTVDFTLRQGAADTLVCSLRGSLAPSTRIVLAPPLPRPLAGLEIDGVPAHTFDAAHATLERCPADVVMRY